MPNFLCTFDLQSNGVDRAAFMDALAEHGWSFLITDEARTVLSRLPNTTVWGSFTDRAQASERFAQAVSDVGIGLRSAYKPVITKQIIAQIELYPAFSSNERAQKIIPGRSNIECCLRNQQAGVLPY